MAKKQSKKALVKPKATLGGYSELKNCPEGAEDCNRYLWAIEVKEKIPYLNIFATYRGYDKGEEPQRCGRILDISIVPPADKPLKAGVNRTEAKKFSTGLVFACQDEKSTETTDYYVMLGNVMEDECCPDHFPERTDDFWMDAQKVLGTFKFLAFFLIIPQFV